MTLLVKKIHMRLTQTLMRMWSNRKRKWKWNRKRKLKSINLPKMEFQKKNQQKPYLSFHLCQVILTEKYFSCLDLFLPMKFESQLIGTVNQNWTFHSEIFRGKNKACFWSIGSADVKNIRKLNIKSKINYKPVQRVNAPTENLRKNYMTNPRRALEWSTYCAVLRSEIFRHRGQNWGPKLHPKDGLFGPWSFMI